MGRNWIALLADSHAWPLGLMFFFVWGEFFLPSYSTLDFALVNRGENIIMSSDAVGIKINIFLRIVTNVRRSWGCLATCLKSPLHRCTRLLECSLPFANCLPNVERVLRSPYFSSSNAGACNFVFFEQKSAVYFSFF